MGKRTTRKSPGKKGAWGSLFAGIFLILLAWITRSTGLWEMLSPESTPAASLSLPQDAGELQVWYIDIGQGDSQYIRTPSGKDILIDAGDTYAGDSLVSWLQDQGIEKLDMVIVTHPHADHIGGMSAVLQAFPPDVFYMPSLPESQIPTSRCYEEMLLALEENGNKITTAKAGVIPLEEEGLRLEFLAPGTGTYDSLNNYSAVVRLTYGERNFLFMGDAETPVEEELLANHSPLQADVLKCGHHGSNTSTSLAFLKAVSPSAAVISCGADNEYGHPHEEILTRLQQASVTIYRTDTQGTLCAVTNGHSLSFHTDLPSAWED